MDHRRLSNVYNINFYVNNLVNYRKMSTFAFERSVLWKEQ